MAACRRLISSFAMRQLRRCRPRSDIRTATPAWGCGPCGAECMNVAPARLSESGLRDMERRSCSMRSETTMRFGHGFETVPDSSSSITDRRLRQSPLSSAGPGCRQPGRRSHTDGSILPSSGGTFSPLRRTLLSTQARENPPPMTAMGAAMRAKSCVEHTFSPTGLGAKP